MHVHIKLRKWIMPPLSVLFEFMFVIGPDRETKTPTYGLSEEPSWKSLWMCETATSVYHMMFSPDGTLFATCGRNDRLVKIWYENKQVLFPSRNPDKDFGQDDVEHSYTYVYIAHPRAVTQLTWRKTSKYMPKGSVSNMIVTSCLDNICRIWIQTVLPDDGLINMTQFDPLAIENPKFRTHRHKHRFIQRLKHMKACFHVRRHVKNGSQIIANGFNELLDIHGRIPSLPSSCSVHDFHSYGYHGTGVSPGMHFHLAASINAETDIPLVPTLKSTNSYQNNFILHWLNNKEMYFSFRAEVILQELTKKVFYEEKKNDLLITAEDNEPITQRALSFSHTTFSEGRDTFETVKNKAETIQTAFQESSIPKTSSLNSLKNSNTTEIYRFADSLDVKIDCLLRDWHQDPDLLFAVHPVDGSFLIWLIEWLDDYYPGSFRQAQVSFSTRIPSALPLGDSTSLSPSISLFLSSSYPIILKEVNNAWKNCSRNKNECFTETDRELSIEESSSGNVQEKAAQMNETGSLDPFCPSVSMVTKHSNGTLNLWQLNFALKTKFTQVLSIGHVSRASGHRFRVNDITCHPNLPLLVSTSHHNMPEAEKKDCETFESESSSSREVFTPLGFCSELILWKVDAVGPLGHSGGVSELARINSPNISAFSNVAWIPTLLPSTTFGNNFHSPSACFVASDGDNLRVYQAVIDARSLLTEISSSHALPEACSKESFNSNTSSSNTTKHNFRDKLKVVSQQSTARPGCIIQLDAISDAKHDWQNTQFLHVFQEQLIIDCQNRCGVRTPVYSKKKTDVNCDCNEKFVYEENFFIVIIEKTLKGSTLHMWRITLTSLKSASSPSEVPMYIPDTNLTQEIDDSDIGCRHRSQNIGLTLNVDISSPNISINTKKVCTQELPLPEGVDVVHASPAAGHLSSSSIYPACLAPYIIVTACSDSISRFWKCKTSVLENSNTYSWREWEMLGQNRNSTIDIPGQPLNISAAYSCRIACAYKYGKSFTRPSKGDPDSRYINLCVGIYECESTGGCEWALEDTIHLKNIYLPSMNIDHSIDLSYLHDSRFMKKKQRLNQMLHTITHDENRSPRSGETTPESTGITGPGILAVPSFSTLQSLRKSIAENGNTCPLTQKHLVQLDWVSKEDGSHILTVAVGSKILLYTAVSSDIAQANIKAMKESKSVNRPLLRKASSLAQTHFNDEIRWMKLRQIDLETADGLPALPMQISWVRDGILVVAMDSETHVYSQWKPRNSAYPKSEDVFDTRDVRDEDIRSLANEKTYSIFRNTPSMPLMGKISAANLQPFLSDKKRKCGSVGLNNQNSADAAFNTDYMTDLGLFQASRVACPVLPQYHPKQLMELLNSGKIHWVKAILAHLVFCMRDSIHKEKYEEDVPRQEHSTYGTNNIHDIFNI